MGKPTHPDNQEPSSEIVETEDDVGTVQFLDDSQPDSVSISMSVSPLPAPEILAAYDQIAPGTTERLVSIIEKEQDMRREELRYDGRTNTLIVASSLVVSVGLIVGACVCAALGAFWVAALMGSAGAITGIWKLHLDRLYRED